jgi:NAD-dependent deacetylase
METLETALTRLHSAKRIAVLTGAGISKPSGIPTFRDAVGLWKDFDIEEYATPSAYERNPQKVWEWYGWRYRNVLEALPNRAHHLLVELDRKIPSGAEGEGVIIVTQNVDGLHQRAGSSHVIELHGNLTHARCESCGYVFPLPQPEHLALPPQCPECGLRGRPNVVWFGEYLPEAALDTSQRAFAFCDVALVIGTSGVVEPAASLGRFAKHAGGFLIEINPEETPLSSTAHLSLRMGAIEGMETLMAQR